MTLKPALSDTRPNLEEAKLLQDLEKSELERVRKAADSWRTGLAGLIAIVTGYSAIKGRETIEALPHWAQYTIGILVLLVIVFSVWGAYFGLAAAFGEPRTSPGNIKIRDLVHMESVRAINQLNNSKLMTFFAILFLIVAIGFTWYVPDAPKEPLALIQVVSNGQTTCGEVVGVENGQMLVLDKYYSLPPETINPPTIVRVDLTKITSLELVEECK